MMQTIMQTYHEKVDMYRKCEKEDLIVMLIEANRIIDEVTPLEYSLSREPLDSGKRPVIEGGINQSTTFITNDDMCINYTIK